MKKTAKRTLAILLAALMTLALGTAAMAAPSQPRHDSAQAQAQQPNWTVSITQQPTDNTFTMPRWYDDGPKLAGLKVSVSGGTFTTPEIVTYVEDDTPALGKTLWYFWVETPDGWWKLGENTTVLHVSGYKCVTFHPEITDGGVEYGWFDEERVFEGSTPIKFTVRPYTPTTFTVLREGDANAETVTLYYDRDETVVFQFTAETAGFYSFKSTGAQQGGTWYSEDGAELTINGVYPYAELFDANDNYLGDGYRGYGKDFAIFRQMAAGEVVYLYVNGWAFEDTDITVTAHYESVGRPPLALASDKVTINYHECIDLDALLEGTGLTIEDVRFDYDYQYLDWWYGNGPHGVKRGVTTLTVEAPNGGLAQVEVTIKYSLAQWLCVILLGGWSWLQFTSVGPFDLLRDIKLLMDYGLFNGLNVWFHSWFNPILYGVINLINSFAYSLGRLTWY